MAASPGCFICNFAALWWEPVIAKADAAFASFMREWPIVHVRECLAP